MNKFFTVIGGKFKFQVQDSDLEYFFWRSEKLIALSEKKPPLVGRMYGEKTFFLMVILNFRRLKTSFQATRNNVFQDYKGISNCSVKKGV